MHASPEYVYQAFCAGASGYVLKESAGDEVVAAVRAVHAGQRFLSEKIPATAVDAYARTRSAEHPLERLSPRELQVLKLIVEGSTSNDVAAMLAISPKSVDETCQIRDPPRHHQRGVTPAVRISLQTAL